MPRWTDDPIEVTFSGAVPWRDDRHLIRRADALAELDEERGGDGTDEYSDEDIYRAAVRIADRERSVRCCYSA